jgi:hypothetical protein
MAMMGLDKNVDNDKPQACAFLLCLGGKKD